MKELRRKNMTRSQCSGWKAWQDNMPGSSPTIYVTGACRFPTTGYSVALEPVVGTNPPGLLQLEYKIHKPEDQVLQVITEVEAHYSQDTNAVYQEVQILPDNIKIAVEQVH
jgi:hypothetical protein